MTDQKGSTSGKTEKAAPAKAPAAKKSSAPADKAKAAAKKDAAKPDAGAKPAAEKKSAPKTAEKASAKAATGKTAPARKTAEKPAPAKVAAARHEGEAGLAAKASAEPKKASAPKKSAAPKSGAKTAKTTAAHTSAESKQEGAPAVKAPAKAGTQPKSLAAETEKPADALKNAATPSTPAGKAKPASRRASPKPASVKAAVEGEQSEKAPASSERNSSSKGTVAPKASGKAKPAPKSASKPEGAAQAPAVQAQRPESATPSFDDRPEAAGTSEAAAPAGEGSEESGKSGRKRRNRSRRGRGKKKQAEAALKDTGGENAAETFDDDEAETNADSGAEAPAAQNRKMSDDDDDAPAKKGRRKMFVSVQPEEQVEVVITEEGQVQEYYVEMLHQAKVKGNIYKGVIHNVDANLQAAFVSYGASKNGFLQIDEVHPEYYNVAQESAKGRKYPPIQKVLKAGQEVLVQVVKEPTGTKGAFLTTYLSLPGRFLVLTPGREQIGVSRKVENEGERSRLRDLLEGLNPGPGLGVIVRTVSMGASKTNLQRDLAYLKKVWKEVRGRGTSETAPCLVYQEMDLTTRAVRDYLTEEVAEIWMDEEKTAAEITEIAEALFPRKKGMVRLHKEANSTLFERFNVQRQLDQIHSRSVSLPSGGQLVFDVTEALTAIDINSGRSGGKNNFEDMAFRTNLEAAKMIPLQLRLRDIGGQVVADFIEMRDKNHWREVEKALRAGMKVDRARYDVGKIGPFGMLEIVRQRLGSSAISVSSEPCPHCKGTGVLRNMEWQSQQAMRDIQKEIRAAQGKNETEVVFETESRLALFLLNEKRRRLSEMEQAAGVRLEIRIKHSE